MNEPVNYAELFLSTSTQWLKVFCYALIACSSLCLLLFFLILGSASVIYPQSGIVLLVLVIAADILLPAFTLGLIKDAGYSRVPPVKKQFVYLLLVYICIFSLILHLAFLLVLLSDLSSINALLALKGTAQQVFLFSFIIVTILSTILLPVVQVRSFKFIKLLRHAEVVISGDVPEQKS